MNKTGNNVEVESRENLIGREVYSPDKDLKSAGIFHNYVKEEVGEKVYNYFDEIGVFQTNELLILSSRHSYSYDQDFLQHIRIIFNLKPLNTISKVNLMFFKLNRILTRDGYYIGYYDDIYTVQENLNKKYTKTFAKLIVWLNYYLPHIFLNLPVINILASAIGISSNKCLSISNVHKIMANNGFSVVITKKFDNKTFFVAKKNRKVKRSKILFLSFIEKLAPKYILINV